MLPAGLEAHKLQTIRRVDLFSGLRADELSLVAAMSYPVRKARGTIIYMQEDPADSFFVVDQGRVKISLLSLYAKEIILEIIEPGGIFGELAIVDDSPHVTMAEALDDVLLYVISRQNFKSIIASHPEIVLRLAKAIGSRFRKIERKVSDLVNKDVSARITDLLIDLATTHSNGGDAPGEILLRLKQQDVAGLIGACRQSATEALNNLEKMGWIELGRGFIRIRSLDSLRSQQVKFTWILWLCHLCIYQVFT
jgi:CRP/FNR family transcriptional regulator, cyclic AMP receptor protein